MFFLLKYSLLGNSEHLFYLFFWSWLRCIYKPGWDRSWKHIEVPCNNLVTPKGQIHQKAQSLAAGFMQPGNSMVKSHHRISSPSSWRGRNGASAMFIISSPLNHIAPWRVAIWCEVTMNFVGHHLLFFLNKYLFVYSFICVCAYTWDSENNQQKLVLSSTKWGPKDEI